MIEPIDLTGRSWGPWIAGQTVIGIPQTEIVEAYRGGVLAHIGVADPGIVDQAVQAAVAAAPVARALPVHQRATVLRRAADLVEESAEELAQIVTRSTGKVIKDTLREARRVAWTYRASATAAETLEGELYAADAMPGGERVTAYSLRQPVGVVAAISPFNAPLNLVAHKLGPGLAAGNTMVVKPASAARLPALRLAHIFHEAGLPPGIINVIPGGPDVAQALVRHDDVGMITFTGGRRAGEEILRSAGVKRVLLELGGNSPNLVHRDANLHLAVEQITRGGFANNGQSCNSVQRIYVHRRVMDEFSALLVGAVRRLKVGDPMDPSVDVGPLVDEASAIRIAEWIEEAQQSGAEVLTGGSRDGSTIQPTVVAKAPEDCRLTVDEIFAPVVLLFPYDELDDAITRANSTTFGLQSAIFTASLDVASKAVRELVAGAVLVNRSSNFRLDHLPYGGVKASGIGREGPREAIREMSELKLVVIAPSESEPAAASRDND